MNNIPRKILIDITHPADVHQFRFIIENLKERNEVLIVARYNKDSVIRLLEKYNIEYIKRRGYNSFLGKIFGLLLVNIQLFRIAKKFKADILVGSTGNCYVSQVAWLLKKTSVILDDTEHTSFQNKLTFPFASKVITPDSYYLELGKKQVKYVGTKEMFYLSKSYFIPSELIKSELEKEDKVFFLRIIAWNANHDIGKTNTFNVRSLVQYLKPLGRVLISAEGDVEESLKPYLIPDKYKNEYHSVLYYSDLVITEGASTAAEAAVLGTPCIYINPLTLGYIDYLESKDRIISTTNINSLKQLINDFGSQKKIESQKYL